MLKNTARCFIAIPLPNDMAKSVGDYSNNLQELLHLHTWSFMKTLDYHITLQFLGNVEQTVLPEICQRLQRIAGSQACFRAEIAKPVWFPSQQHANVLALGVRAAEQLTALALTVQNALADLNLAQDKRVFLPHVTIARCKQSHDVSIKPMCALPQTVLVFAVNQIGLYQSHLELPQGQRYQELAAFTLQ